MITQETVQAVADEIYAVLKRHGVGLGMNYDGEFEIYESEDQSFEVFADEGGPVEHRLKAFGKAAL